MTACPVCEHSQAAGDTCEVCGWRLAGAPAAAAEAAATPMADLESTRLAPTPDAPVALLGELEPTRVAAAETPVATEDGSAWVEQTAFGRVEAVTVEAIEVERVEAAAKEAAVDLFAQPTCRYCRTAALPGDAFCGKCGMKIAAAGAPRPEPEAGPRRCPVCGAKATGALCLHCSTRVPQAEEA
jgi:hypothetical protein